MCLLRFSAVRHLLISSQFASEVGKVFVGVIGYLYLIERSSGTGKDRETIRWIILLCNIVHSVVNFFLIYAECGLIDYIL